MRRRADQLIPFEITVLEAGVTLRRRGTIAFHGYALAKAIKTSTDNRMLTAHGTLYRALHRLERAGLIEGFWENPGEAERESRPRRRLYRLTASSEAALSHARAEQRARAKLRALKEGLGTP